MAGTMDKIKAKVDNVLHKDKTHNDPTGPHSSHAANTADPRVGNTTGTHTGTHTTGSGLTGSHGTTGTTHGTHGTTGGLGTTHGSDPTGPHSSHMANQADPRVDSDRLGTAGNTSGAGGYGAGQYGSNTTHSGTTGGLTGGSHNTHGTTGLGSNTTHGTTGLGSNTTHGTTHGDPSGPHSSKMANKLDPTVDTKSYGTADPTTGHYANTHGSTGSGLTGSHNTHGTTGSGLTGSHNTHGTTGSGLTGSHGATGYSDPTGPHSSHMANQADPRVDSDRYGAAGNTSGAGGYGAGQYGSNTGSGLTGSHGTHTGTTGSGLTGNHNTHGTTGSGLTGTHGAHGGTVGSGNSNTTAGPHNSDMLNKVDPRVDSDLDGSKTYGGNQTYR